MSERERHHDLDELLGAYALDALDADERRLVEEYLVHNPRARDEVQQHREVATLLSYTGAPAPEGLWERIADALDGPAPAPGPELARVLPGPGTARRRFRTWLPTALVAAAASVVIAVLAVRLADTNRQLDASRDGAFTQLFEEARRDASARVAQLASTDGTARTAAVVTTDGTGYLDGRPLVGLDADHTYQLWGVVQGPAGPQVISLGVLGARFEVVPFTVRQGTLLKLVLTEEVRGGVPVSSQPAALAGDLV